MNAFLAAVPVCAAMLCSGMVWSQCVQAAPQAVPTIQTSVRSVVVDVFPKANAWAMPSTLPVSAFRVVEDGKTQTVDSATWIPLAGSLQSSYPGNSLWKASEDEQSNDTAARGNQLVSVLLLDTLNTSLADQARARKQAIAALRALPAGQHIALFTLGTSLRQVQSFTGSTDTLIAAADRVGLKPSPLYVEHGPDQVREDDSLSGANLQKAQQAQRMTAVKNPQERAILAAQLIDRAFGEAGARRLDIRVALTVGSLKALADALSAVPGRKRLIWVGGSLPLSLRADAGTGEAPEMTRDYGLQFQDAATRLADAGVAVYAVDASGLSGIGPDASVASADAPDALYRDRNVESIHATQSTLQNVADATGGTAYLNGNDLATAIRDALLPPQGFYRITYRPLNKKFDGGFRTISLKIAGVKASGVQYRRGYTASAEPSDPSQQSERRFLRALAESAPAVGDVTFKAKTTQQQGRVTVDLLVNTANLQLTPVPGCGEKLNLVAAAIPLPAANSSQGQAVQSFEQVLSPDAAAAALTHGLRLRLELAMKATSTLKLGILDRSTGRFGTLLYLVPEGAAR